ncbi:putative lipid II flippase MurJ [Oceaniferula spumae]|uniref:Lipid II flippase MurJ n=1 Tax=Oceaniferula spumae TaxID=2979115 RepID=A0AAT9FH52_9BACT
MSSTTVTRDIAPPQKSVLRLLVRCISTIAGLSLAAKGIGFLRDAAAASMFGTSDAMDAYVLALSVPTLLAGLLGAAMPTALVPAYANAKKQLGEKAAVSVVANGIFLQTLLAVVICALLAVCSGPLMQMLGGDFDQQKTLLSRNLFLLLLLFSIIYSTATAATAALQAEMKFSLGALAPAVVPAVAICLLFALYSSTGIYSLAIGLVVGSLCYLGMLMGGVVRQFGIQSMIPRLRGHGTGKLMRDCMLLLLGGAAFGGCVVIDMGVASRLDAGSVATLGYADKVLGIVLSLAGVALGQALLPYLSEMSANSDYAGLRKIGGKVSWLVLLVTIPMVLGLWFLAEPVTRLLFERGEFGSGETYRVADALRWGSLQFPAAALGIVASRMVIATGGIKYMCIVSTTALVANFFLDITLAPHFGLAGILIATALVHAISAGLLFLKIPKS